MCPCELRDPGWSRLVPLMEPQSILSIKIDFQTCKGDSRNNINPRSQRTTLKHKQMIARIVTPTKMNCNIANVT